MVSGLLLGDFPGFGHKLVWSMYSRVWVSLSVCVYYVSNDYNIAQISVEYLMITCERDYCLHIYLTLTCERSDYLWQHVVFNFPVMLIISFIVKGTILKYSNSSGFVVSLHPCEKGWNCPLSILSGQFHGSCISIFWNWFSFHFLFQCLYIKSCVTTQFQKHLNKSMNLLALTDGTFIFKV